MERPTTDGGLMTLWRTTWAVAMNLGVDKVATVPPTVEYVRNLTHGGIPCHGVYNRYYNTIRLRENDPIPQQRLSLVHEAAHWATSNDFMVWNEGHGRTFGNVWALTVKRLMGAEAYHDVLLDMAVKYNVYSKEMTR